MKRLILDADLVRIAGQSQAWRWTQLSDAIIADTDCCPSTARRAINRGVQLGLLHHQRGLYQLSRTGPQLQSPRTYTRLDRRQLLTTLAEREAWPYTTMLSELRKRLGVAETTLRASLTYARQYGYLQRGEAGWALTIECRHQLAHYGQLEGPDGFRFAAFLWASQTRTQTRRLVRRRQPLQAALTHAGNPLRRKHQRPTLTTRQPRINIRNLHHLFAKKRQKLNASRSRKLVRQHEPLLVSSIGRSIGIVTAENTGRSSGAPYLSYGLCLPESW